MIAGQTRGLFEPCFLSAERRATRGARNFSMTLSSFPAPAGATPYADLNGVLDQLVRRVAEAAGDNFVGAYLQGSFALGGFDEASDVDFVIALKRDLTEAELPVFQALHGEIFDLPAPWAQHLEGSYFPLEVLRRAGDGPPASLAYLDNGARALTRHIHCNTQVVRWTLREKGVTLAGPPPAELVDPVSPEALKAEMRALMRDEFPGWLDKPSRIDANWLQAFWVTLCCRMLHSFETGAVSSKKAASDWAVAHLEPRWRGLIERSWRRGRAPLAEKLAAADRAEVAQTLAFMRHAMSRAAGGAGHKGPHGLARTRPVEARGGPARAQSKPTPIRPGGRGRRG
jgi:predicted nucleotidyltransferase